MTDEQLFAAMADGDHGALAELIDRYQRLVFSIARKIIKDDGEAEGVTQETFLKLFTHAGRFDAAKGTVKTYLMRYAYTGALKRRDALQRRGFYANCELPSFLPREAGHDRALLLREGLAALDSKQRQAVELMGLEGLSLNEATVVMGYTLAAVRNYYFRGKLRLKELLT